ncbi:MAG: hypothetical protein KKE23_01370 [Nanoarchaeota archaeon]|nr:hypothetical protein [Nanoarchaeota archaeon]
MDFDHEISIPTKNTGNSTIHDLCILIEVDKEIVGKVELSDPIHSDEMSPDTTSDIHFGIRTKEKLQTIPLTFTFGWRDDNEQCHLVDKAIELIGQKVHSLDWDRYRRENPYLLTWINNPVKLRARGNIIDRLRASIRNKEIVRIYGEKRVGKTSIVKVIESEFSGQEFPFYLAVVIPWGAVIKGNPGEVGFSICEKVYDSFKKRFPKRESTILPLGLDNFHKQLEPLVGWLDNFAGANELERILIMLDDCEYMPVWEEESNRQFYNALKTIGTTGNNVLFLVGSEEFRKIFTRQMSSVINVGSTLEITYITEKSEQDEIIEKPAEGILEYDRNAVDLIIKHTAGNPWFVNKICNKVYEEMTKIEDGYVTTKEIEDAVNTISNTSGEYGHYSHFWLEGIDVPTKDNREDLCKYTAYILLAIAKVKRSSIEYVARNGFWQSNKPWLSKIKERQWGVILQNLVTRGVLERREENTEIFYRIKLGLLHAWLRGIGRQDILEKFPYLEEAGEENNGLEIRPAEIKEFCDNKNWVFGSELKTITTTDIQAWLDNFESAQHRRWAFLLLKAIKFYRRKEIINALKDNYEEICRRTPEHIIGAKMSISNIFVTVGDEPGKSGSALLYYFNQIMGGKARSGGIPRIAKFLEDVSLEGRKKTIIIMNDFVGTGDSAKKEIEQIYNKIKGHCEERNVNIYYSAVSGFVEAIDKVKKEKKGKIVDVIVHDLLFDAGRAFNRENKEISLSVEEIEAAEKVFKEIGIELYNPANALGYHDCQALVVFEHKIPNDTLPIFWSSKSAGGKDWVPLFPKEK